MGQIISIVSGKGGVGKTTICANLAFSLALQGNKVVCIDADVGLHNLDLILGMEDKTIFDLGDVLEERCPVDKARVVHDDIVMVSLIPAAGDFKTTIDVHKFRKLCTDLSRDNDYVLVDAPAGLGNGFDAAVGAADRVLVVATPDIASIRDAGRTAALITDAEQIPVHLIVNRMRSQFVKKGYAENVDAMMDEIGLPLIGILPEDDMVIVCSNGRKVLPMQKCISCDPYKRIAFRLMGNNQPLSPLWRK